MNKKKLLLRFIDDPKAKESDIEEVNYRLFKYNGRYYHVEDLHYVIYGDPWYEKNYWKDYGHYRVSIEMYTCHGRANYNGKCGRSLHVGGEEVYCWKNRTDNYKKKSKAQIKALANNYVQTMLRDFQKKNREPDFDIETARRLLNHDLWQSYGDWFGTAKKGRKKNECHN